MVPYRHRVAWKAHSSGGRARGLQVFDTRPAEILAEHLREARQRARRGEVRLPERLVHEVEDVLRSLAEPAPYVISFADVGGWRAEMRVVEQNSRLVVADIRVTPVTNDLPTGGITARLLRQVPVHGHIHAFAEMLRSPDTRDRLEELLLGTGLEAVLAAHTSGPAPPTSSPRRGRRPIAMQTLLEVASAYAKASAARSHQPTQDAATQLGVKLARARDLVHRARMRGLLTPAEWGQPGGELTPLARTLLKQRSRQTRPRPHQRKPR